ncbi:MAG: hypothetical protein MHM6MM_002021 [Cercozoa sp. M6MM]
MSMSDEEFEVLASDDEPLAEFAGNGDTVAVSFVSGLRDPALVVDSGAVSVPDSLNRAGLSAIVNQLLDEKVDHYEKMPLDIVVAGRLLRSSLSHHCLKHQVSRERVLQVKYVALAPAPSPEPSLPQPDWVSAISVSHDVVLTGAYDGTVRLHQSTQQVQHKAHRRAIKDMACFKRKTAAEALDFATVGKDRVARVWRLQDNKISELASVIDTRGSLECVATAPRASKRLFAVGGFSNAITVAVVTEGESVKEGDVRSENAKLRHELSGHSAEVTSLCWPDELALYSASADHSVRLWDPRHGMSSRTWHCSRAVNALDFNARASLLATAHNDGVRVWDARAHEAGDVAQVTLRHSQSQWTSAVSWAPASQSEYLLASCSYAGDVKVWDVRTTVPLHSLKAHDDKALCLVWHSSALYSGGADKQLCRHRFAEAK